MTDRERRIQALRALIARPGTPAEGEAAQRALARVLASGDEEPKKSAGRAVEEIFARMAAEDMLKQWSAATEWADLKQRAREEMRRAEQLRREAEMLEQMKKKAAEEQYRKPHKPHFGPTIHIKVEKYEFEEVLRKAGTSTEDFSEACRKAAEALGKIKF